MLSYVVKYILQANFQLRAETHIQLFKLYQIDWKIILELIINTLYLLKSLFTTRLNEIEGHVML